MLTFGKDIGEHTWHMLGELMHENVEAFYGLFQGEVFSHHIFRHQ